jgi:hypothetical protein
MSTKRVLTIVLTASAVLLAAGIGPQVANTALALPPAQAGVTIPYSGSLADESGQPVADGAYAFTFALYEAETGGSPLWTEAQEGVAVQDGAFNTLLGSVTPLPKEVLDGGALWLEVGVRGPGEAGFTTLTPRQEVSAAASVAQAGLAAPAKGLSSSCAHTHFGETWSGSGVGLHLISSNDTPVWASTSGGWAGVDGRNTTGAGVRGSSTSGAGVVGQTTTTTGDNTTGVWGQVASNASYARAVVGWATAVIGYTTGVWGQSESASGAGVYGQANNTGCTTGMSGCRGVQGNSDKGYGVNGQTNTGVAVYGYAAGNGVGLRVDGQTGGNLIEAWHGPLWADRRFYVSNAGNVYADGSYTSPAADFAEMLPAVEGLEPGDVLVIGPDGQLTRSSEAYQSTVVGVYSTNPGFVGGSGDDADPAGKIPLAVIGVVLVKASAENGPIHPGDLLTTSSTPGYAMKADPITLDGITFYPSGVTIGKALGSLESGTGVIQMLVILQ